MRHAEALCVVLKGVNSMSCVVPQRARVRGGSSALSGRMACRERSQHGRDRMAAHGRGSAQATRPGRPHH